MNPSPIRPAAPARLPARPPAPRRPDPAEMTALQRHVDFFDRDHDGRVTIAETRAGLEALGLGSLKARLGALFINLGLARKTESGSKTVIDVATIHRAKHDSDTDNLDEQGRFDAARFEAWFAATDANRSGTLDEAELAAMLAARKETRLGAFAAKQEWDLLLGLAADGTEAANGKAVRSLSKARIQGLYDGSLFPQLAGSVNQKVLP